MEAGLLLRQMTGVRRVLVVGAHPDDEDTALLAELDRHRGVRAAYLSLTRGEGGQNLIGPELGKGLGLIRTGELLAARRLDGAEQFFTRAYDFGYSKTAEETFRHWPREALLNDVVWVLRLFRPHVVVSVFSGTEADGHGQHQVAGVVTREAFRAAADPERFPEHMEWGARPWRPLKLYRRAWRDPENATLRISTGDYDPLLGRSPFQLAMESRSQHRSQDFGVAQPPGPRTTRLLLLEDRVGAPADAPLFAGIDTGLATLAVELPRDRRREFRRRIDDYRRAVMAARASLRILDPAEAAPALERALEAIRGASSLAAGPSRPRPGAGPDDERVGEVLERKERLVERALLAVRGVTVRFRTASERWVRGGTARVHAEVWNGGAGALRAGPPELDLPAGWTARRLPPEEVGRTASETSRFYGSEPPLRGGDGALRVPGGAVARWTFAVRIPSDAEPTEPYFLARDTAGDLYRWPGDGRLRARPLDPPVAAGRLPVEIGPPDEAPRVTASGPARHRGVDKARGEFWRPVRVVPRLSVEASPGVVVWPARVGEPTVDVTLRSLASGDLEARVGLRGRADGSGAEGGTGGGGEEGPEVTARPREERVRLGDAGQETSVPFRLMEAPPEPSGAFRTHRLLARAEPAGGGSGGSDGSEGSAARGDRSWSRSLTVVDYPHIDPVPFYEEASVRVERFPVALDRGRRVGYVMGSGDEVPDAIRQLGLEVEMLGPERVRAGDFEGLDVIVLGVRAYEVRRDLRSANDRLLRWVREGGTLLVQYNKYEFDQGDYAPFPVTIARPHDRVTDERSPVTLLHPDAPVLASPNRIGDRDFEGWIQERGLYFLHSWPEEMTPVLAMRDPGEEPKRGALLVAPLGEGLYVHTGLAFFRQLPAGVPGAYRLFANLLSLEPGPWRSWLAGEEEAATAAGARGSGAAAGGAGSRAGGRRP